MMKGSSFVQERVAFLNFLLGFWPLCRTKKERMIALLVCYPDGVCTFELETMWLFYK